MACDIYVQFIVVCLRFSPTSDPSRFVDLWFYYEYKSSFREEHVLFIFYKYWCYSIEGWNLFCRTCDRSRVNNDQTLLVPYDPCVRYTYVCDRWKNWENVFRNVFLRFWFVSRSNGSDSGGLWIFIYQLRPTRVIILFKFRSVRVNVEIVTRSAQQVF